MIIEAGKHGEIDTETIYQISFPTMNSNSHTKIKTTKNFPCFCQLSTHINIIKWWAKYFLNYSDLIHTSSVEDPFTHTHKWLWDIRPWARWECPF